MRSRKMFSGIFYQSIIEALMWPKSHGDWATWFSRNSILIDCKHNEKQRNYPLCLALSLN